MDWNKKNKKDLVESILLLDNADEAQRFLRDLLTEDEIEEFTNRLKAAKMLSDKIPYSTIEKETGLSSTTVARVSKWLNRGNNGYKIVLNRLHHHNRLPREEIGGG